jgi:ethanolamine utilization cobalamin adenosyltransferase
MAQVTMSAQRLLNERGKYEDRINNGILKVFVTANKKSNDTVNGIDLDKYKDQMKGNFQSVKALIEGNRPHSRGSSMS